MAKKAKKAKSKTKKAKKRVKAAPARKKKRVAAKKERGQEVGQEDEAEGQGCSEGRGSQGRCSEACRSEETARAEAGSGSGTRAEHAVLWLHAILAVVERRWFGGRKFLVGKTHGGRWAGAPLRCAPALRNPGLPGFCVVRDRAGGCLT